MTAVIDPNGTPSPVYTRSGTTLQTVTANGTTAGSATQIIAPSGRSVVVVATSSGNTAVLLPAGADVGDVVEAYSDPSTFDPGHPPTFFPSGMETIRGGAVSSISLGAFGGLFRKVSSSDWLFLIGS